MNRFDAPGFLNDLDEQGLGAWSKWVSDRIDECRALEDPRFRYYGPRPQFFNPLTDRPGTDAIEQDISWTAFPRIVKLNSTGDHQRWDRADSSRDVQDEYCEWSVRRDSGSGKITRVDFTCEGPEYWTFLAVAKPMKVLELYREHVDKAVTEKDLFPGGRYNPRNRWNATTTTGAMHLIQESNTLGAEIELAAGASIPRTRNGALLSDKRELIECGRYGVAERNSDPHIGGEVNALARQKADVALANPVGLYLADLSTAGWDAPDKTDPLAFWTVTRGTATKALRAKYEVPTSQGYVVGDIKINGKNIGYGAQIADFITIKLTGLATRFGKSAASPMPGCVTEVHPGTVLSILPLSVQESLKPRVRSRR